MQSTYEQFIKTFKDDLHRVAEFEGEADQTLSVITGALESANLKQLLDELDGHRQKVARAPVAPVEPVRRAVAGGRGKKTATVAATSTTTANEVVENEPTEKKKARRVTGYNIFVAEQVREKKSTMTEAAAVWKTMDTTARAPYIEKAAAQSAAA